ncbi:hypothetical protein HNR77_004473 [Paenibacillus sp. JGP012]|uniref:hypothetical protein n=1 Tax=Paenibacillus sp. JGP012 TaxID=2735914 RepID=UPI001610CA96|nr:hypothetical protein [Paenibacillus sp. JGP012]MBB6023373.1 hypothetical protein [Paenibacillus sp. JGP012]
MKLTAETLIQMWIIGLLKYFLKIGYGSFSLPSLGIDSEGGPREFIKKERVRMKSLYSVKFSFSSIGSIKKG